MAFPLVEAGSPTEGIFAKYLKLTSSRRPTAQSYANGSKE
jgi:hypothetical protein